MIFASKIWARTGVLMMPVLALLLLSTGCAPAIPAVPTAIPTATPRPTDLGAAMVTKPAYPALSYGIHAFLWWNESTRPRDLENVRVMRFSYVKQIFDWTDIRPDPELPPN